LTPDIPPDIPRDQIDRILEILKPLLSDLRARTRALPPEADLPLVYDVDYEAGR